MVGTDEVVDRLIFVGVSPEEDRGETFTTLVGDAADEPLDALSTAFEDVPV